MYNGTPRLPLGLVILRLYKEQRHTEKRLCILSHVRETVSPDTCPRVEHKEWLFDTLVILVLVYAMLAWIEGLLSSPRHRLNNHIYSLSTSIHLDSHIIYKSSICYVLNGDRGTLLDYMLHLESQETWIELEDEECIRHNSELGYHRV